MGAPTPQIVTKIETGVKFRMLLPDEVVQSGDYVSATCNTSGCGLIPLRPAHSAIGKKVEDLVNYTLLNFYRQIDEK